MGIFQSTIRLCISYRRRIRDWAHSLLTPPKIHLPRNQPRFLVCPCCTCEPSAVVYTVVFSIMEYELLLMDKRNLSFPFWLNICIKIKTALVRMTRRRCKYWDRPYSSFCRSQKDFDVMSGGWIDKKRAWLLSINLWSAHEELAALEWVIIFLKPLLGLRPSCFWIMIKMWW